MDLSRKSVQVSAHERYTDTEVQVVHGRLIKYDISILASCWENFLRAVKQKLSQTFQIEGCGHVENSHGDMQKISTQPIIHFYVFGHLGDENMHLNM